MSWDVSNVKYAYVFLCTNFNQDLSAWDVSNVTTMNDMFYEQNLQPTYRSWDVSNVTNMADVFNAQTSTKT